MMKSISTVAKAMTGKAVLAVSIAIASGVIGAAPPLNASPLERVTAGPVNVTVNYKGSGTVDAGHRVWVWLFDTPEIGPGSTPIAELSVAKNGDVATFDVASDRVWIAVAYDEKGVMDGTAPPPSGTPIGIYASSTGAPEAVTAGAKGAVTVTFDDSQRMP